MPGYLRLRYGESTRALSAVSFVFMTVLMSGINMYSMALVMKVVLGWDIHFSIWVSSLTVAVYVVLGGLLSAIFNEALQFGLIWGGRDADPHSRVDRSGRLERAWRSVSRATWAPRARATRTCGARWVRSATIPWASTGPASCWGWGWVISFGYWTTDFLARSVLAAKDLRAAKMAPIIGASFKTLVPFIVILPGLLGLAVLPVKLVGEAGGGGYRRPQLQRGAAADAGATGPGAAGALGDHRAHRRLHVGHGGQRERLRHGVDLRHRPALHEPPRHRRHYAKVDAWSTICCVSIGTAYLVMQFLSIMDYVQALFSFFIAPLFGTEPPGMFGKARHAGRRFPGLAAGTLLSVAMWAWAEG